MMTKIDRQATIKVSLCGVDTRTAKSLRLVLKHQGCGEFAEKPCGEASVVILDMDRANAPQELRTLQRKFPTLAIVTISSQELGGTDGVLSVLKPLSTTMFLSTLRLACNARQESGAENSAANGPIGVSKAALGLQERTVAPVKHEVITANRGIAEEFYCPDDFMQGSVAAAMEEARVKRQLGLITCLNDQYILIDHKRGEITTNISGSRMNQVAIIRVGGHDSLPHQVRFLDDVKPPDLPGGAGTTVAAERFIWHLAALTSHGRIPQGTPVDLPVYLRRWPNFTRLEPIQEALRVAAYVIERPSTLGAVAQALKVSPRHVNTFFSAASAIGLSGIGYRKSDRLLASRRSPRSPAGGLLTSLLSRLSKMRIA